jgi:2-polyprenyl-6-methoxyphenol hydroxylase-like FAD-dependent oxidoreductase
LDRPQRRFARTGLNPVALDADRSGVQIDVRPPQPRDFAPAQSTQCQVPEVPTAVAIGDAEHLANFVGGVGLHLGVGTGGLLHRGGDVVRDLSTLDSVGQHGPPRVDGFVQ